MPYGITVSVITGSGIWSLVTKSLPVPVHFVMYSTFLVLKTRCSRITRSIPWLLMPWLLASPGHKHTLYWICRIKGFLCSVRMTFKYQCHLRIEKYICMFSKINSAPKRLIYQYVWIMLEIKLLFLFTCKYNFKGLMKYCGISSVLLIIFFSLDRDFRWKGDLRNSQTVSAELASQ